MSAEPVQHADPLLAHRGPWSEDDYLALGEIHGARVELFDGELVVSPWSDNWHQRLVFLLCREIDRQLADELEAYPGGNVRLATGRINIPDVLVRSPSDELVSEAADVSLVAEIVSRWGRARDRILKPVAYAEAGIPWYLLVERDPELKLVLHRLDGDAYVTHATAAREISSCSLAWMSRSRSMACSADISPHDAANFACSVEREHPLRRAVG